MMEDIIGDYKDKTVTLEDFPFITPIIKTASIHPCNHSNVMKILLDNKYNTIRVDQYLIVFLKFMASVTPGIEHDYTMGI